MLLCGIRMSRPIPEDNQKTRLYVCTTYKDVSELQMCLNSKQLRIPEESVMPENPMPHQHRKVVKNGVLNTRYTQHDVTM